MLHIVLFQPQIPPNTGNIMRLCANTGAALHLVEPIPFDLSDAAVRRAGLDYRDQAVLHVHASLPQLRAALPGRWFAVDVRGTRSHADVAYRDGDVLLFGRERTGLPADVLAQFELDHVLRIPMVPGSRSLNLSNAAAVVLYEAWRHQGFLGAGPFEG